MTIIIIIIQDLVDHTFIITGQDLYHLHQGHVPYQIDHNKIDLLKVAEEVDNNKGSDIRSEPFILLFRIRYVHQAVPISSCMLILRHIHSFRVQM